MDPTQPLAQQPVQSPVQISDFQSKPNYLKTIIFSIMGVLLVVSIIYLYLQNQKLQRQVLTPPVSPTIQAPLPTSKPSTSINIPPDETAGWKTYINNKLGIEFMYPVKWSVPKELSQSTKTEVNFDGKLIIIKGSFYDLILQRELTFDEYVIRNYGDETYRYDFNIDGLIGKRGLEKSVSNYSDIVILAKNNKSTEIISINYMYNPEKEDGKFFDQILSTFKFVDKN